MLHFCCHVVCVCWHYLSCFCDLCNDWCIMTMMMMMIPQGVSVCICTVWRKGWVRMIDWIAMWLIIVIVVIVVDVVLVVLWRWVCVCVCLMDVIIICIGDDSCYLRMNAVGLDIWMSIPLMLVVSFCMCCVVIIVDLVLCYDVAFLLSCRLCLLTLSVMFLWSL